MRDALLPDPMNERVFARQAPTALSEATLLFAGPLSALPIDGRVQASQRASPEMLARIHAAASDALAHRFDILGSGPLRAGKGAAAPGVEGNSYSAEIDNLRDRLAAMDRLLPGVAADYEAIDWALDCKSGWRWPDAARSDSLGPPWVPGADIKIPWELSRFHHFGPLGLAHRLLPESRAGSAASAEMVRQIVDWIAANPVRRGVNWVCAMDVAIRAINWLSGVALCQDAAALTPPFRRLLARSLNAHGLHIERHLEYAPRGTGNHYLADVVGLIAIGAALPEVVHSDRWLLYGLQEMVSELDRQVSRSGVDLEGSIGYHHLVAELFLVGTSIALRIPAERWARLAGVEGGKMSHPTAPPLRPLRSQMFDPERPELFPAEYLARLLGMCRFAERVTKQDGTVPQIGDFDSGRVLLLTPPEGFRPDLDRRFVPALGSQLLQAEGLGDVGGMFIDDAALVVGLSPRSGAVARAATAGRVPLPGEQFIRCEDGWLAVYAGDGYAIAQRGPIWLAASFARAPAGASGGHFHNDLLSFELCWNGTDLFVDGGSYLYTPAPELRNRFRSVAAHNTLDMGKEPRAWPADQTRLFALLHDAEHTEVISADRHGITARAKFAGITHQRTWDWSRQCLVIEDEVRGAQAATLTFNVAPGIRIGTITQEGDGYILVELSEPEGGLNWVLRVAGAHRCSRAEGYYSAGYGRRISSESLRFPLVGRTARSEITSAPVTRP